MMVLGEMADIKWWYHLLADVYGLQIGRDWHWAWDHQRNCWAVEFTNPSNESYFRLLS